MAGGWRAYPGSKFERGFVIPEGGLYKCDGGCNHDYNPVEAGALFPPLPPGCHGTLWVFMETRANSAKLQPE